MYCNWNKSNVARRAKDKATSGANTRAVMRIMCQRICARYRCVKSISRKRETENDMLRTVNARISKSKNENMLECQERDDDSYRDPAILNRINVLVPGNTKDLILVPDKKISKHSTFGSTNLMCRPFNCELFSLIIKSRFVTGLYCSMLWWEE